MDSKIGFTFVQQLKATLKAKLQFSSIEFQYSHLTGKTASCHEHHSTRILYTGPCELLMLIFNQIQDALLNLVFFSG